MKIQQHDGVVVDAAGSRQGFAKRKRGGEVLRREREAPRARGAAALPPSLYRGPRGCAGPGDPISKGGGGGQGGTCPPSQVGRPPSLGFPNPRRRGGPRGAHQPTRGWFPS